MNLKKKKKSAIQTMLDWKHNPTAIENKVADKPYSEKEKELLKQTKF